MKEENENVETSEETSDELYEHFKITVDKGQTPLRIDKFLTSRIQNASRTRIQAAADTDSIHVNGKAVKPSYKVKPYDLVTILLPHPPRDKELKPENIPLNIVYEDKHILIVNKEPGMVVHPGYNNFNGTLVNALMYHLQNLPTSNGEDRPGLVHRIDKDTSGLLVIAKDDYSMSHLAKQFFDHSIRRSYLSLVWGYIQDDEGTITGNLARSLKDRRIMQVYEDETIGKHAITHYNVKERFTYTTLIECVLETGRTHQIRTHMSYIRHAVFNDNMYGGDRMVDGPSFTKYKQFIDNCFALCPRQALHAHTLGFVHPHTKEQMFFECPPPEDMQKLIEKWRNYSTFNERQAE